MQKNKDIITIGFALFAMFFGAGNLLLPPYIGIQIGNHVAITILAFGLTGILLPFLGILSIVKSGNSIQDLGNRIHPYLAPVLGSIIMLCIGPLIAIPRTAATTYEVGILPSFPNCSPFLASFIFFGLTWALTIVPSKVVDIIGNLLTPALLILLLLLIIVGIAYPLSNFSTSELNSSESFALGFVEGYQTLDVLASVIFAGIIITAAKAKGYNSIKEKSKVVVASGLLSALCLFIIYGGLVYLGATSNVTDPNISRSALLIHIAKSTLGDYGMVAIAISIALACLTTAIALTAAVGSFFSDLTGGKIGYKTLVTLCCFVSASLAITGVDNIIKFAYPPLAFVYPIVITLVLYIVLFGNLVKSRAPFIGALIAATIVATIGVLEIVNLLPPKAIELFNKIPFFSIGLGWVIPSILGFCIGFIFNKSTSTTTK